jgi:hypothetical protein
MKNTQVSEQWRKVARQIVAVEMEVAGVYHAARQLHREYPILMIRGISDIIGFKRDNKWTEYACNTAAAFALAVVNTRPIEPRANSGSNSRQNQRGNAEELEARKRQYSEEFEGLWERPDIKANELVFRVFVAPIDDFPEIDKSESTEKRLERIVRDHLYRSSAVFETERLPNGWRYAENRNLDLWVYDDGGIHVIFRNRLVGDNPNASVNFQMLWKHAQDALSATMTIYREIAQFEGDIYLSASLTNLGDRSIEFRRVVSPPSYSVPSRKEAAQSIPVWLWKGRLQRIS